MTSVLIFSVVLLLVVLLSRLAHRTVISTAVLFLVAGFVCGDGVLGWMHVKADNPVVTQLADLALVAVLFTDGMKVGVRDLISAWQLPGRALLFGLPLTLGLTAALAHFITGLNWMESLLVGAVLSPTDPVFASAIVGREHVPGRVRHLLNVESGVNDGLALPIVLILLALVGAREMGLGELAVDLAGGVAMGIAVPWLALWLERTRWFSVSAKYQPLFALAIGMVVWAGCATAHLNEFLGAFSAGITIASVHTGLRDDFHQLGEVLAELLKLAALLVFGALISPSFVTNVHWQNFVFAIAALVLARPLALLPSLTGADLSWPEKLVAFWFGPKGFASVVYAILVLKSQLSDAERIFHLIALMIAISIVAHSSTDVPIARWFQRAKEREA